MKQLFVPGAVKTFTHTVTAADEARFETGTVHRVYSTFALARDAEWSGRLFVLDMLEAGEEGIGTGIDIRHLSPAFIGQQVVFTSTLQAVNKNEVITDFIARTNDRIVATGRQWQKIIPLEKLKRIFEQLHTANE